LHPATLNKDIALPEVDGFIAIEFQVDFTGQDDDVVHRFRTMRKFLVAGSPFGRHA
jgi:hypothetical protein